MYVYVCVREGPYFISYLNDFNVGLMTEFVYAIYSADLKGDHSKDRIVLRAFNLWENESVFALVLEIIRVWKKLPQNVVGSLKLGLAKMSKLMEKFSHKQRSKQHVWH